MVDQNSALMEMNESAFKLCYKYLKRKNPLPDFSRVIDFAKKPFEHVSRL